MTDKDMTEREVILKALRAAAEAHAERLRRLEEATREQLMKERGVS